MTLILLTVSSLIALMSSHRVFTVTSFEFAKRRRQVRTGFNRHVLNRGERIPASSHILTYTSVAFTGT